MAPASFQLIAALVLRETSIVYEPRKEYLVEARLHPLAAQAGCATVDEYVQRVVADPVERRKAIDSLTINETSWFRDNAPYQAFTDTMLPALLANRTDRRHLSIWSAACSSGQEAYSIAMLLDQHLPSGWTADILATDVSTAMLTRVQAGRYSQVEMNRGLPATSLVKYFTRAGSEWEIVPSLRKVVRTRHLNLAEPFPALGTFDLVLLRNVLIYFDQPTQERVLEVLKRLTRRDGVLFIGPAEASLFSRMGMQSLGIAQAFAGPAGEGRERRG